jgi:membrane protease YdiL (CAAX protease family)
MEQRFFSRTGFVLWIGASIGAICVLPYVHALAPQALDDAVQQTGLPVVLIVLLSITQSVIFLGLMCFSGLWAAQKLGLGAPLLDALVKGDPIPTDNRSWASVSIALGVAGVLLLIALDKWLFVPLDPEGIGSILQVHPPAWMGFLASFYGGIAEEVQLRLFLFSFIALAVNYVSRRVGLSRNSGVSVRLFWTVNLVVAVIFGLGHLPATAEILPLTPLIVVRAIVLNGIIGLITGYLFWRRGIEMAILAHFSADIVLHVLLPLLFL